MYLRTESRYMLYRKVYRIAMISYHGPNIVIVTYCRLGDISQPKGKYTYMVTYLRNLESTSKCYSSFFKSLNWLAPAYFRDPIHPHGPPGAVRSSDKPVLSIPNCPLRHKGDQAFSLARCGPASLLHVRSVPTLESFKSRLKTHLFSLDL